VLAFGFFNPLNDNEHDTAHKRAGRRSFLPALRPSLPDQAGQPGTSKKLFLGACQKIALGT
jgi:hypothetical protein